MKSECLNCPFCQGYGNIPNGEPICCGNYSAYYGCCGEPIQDSDRCDCSKSTIEEIDEET